MESFNNYKVRIAKTLLDLSPERSTAGAPVKLTGEDFWFYVTPVSLRYMDLYAVIYLDAYIPIISSTNNAMAWIFMLSGNSDP